MSEPEKPTPPPRRSVLTLTIIATDTPDPEPGSETVNTTLEQVGAMSARNARELLEAVRIVRDWVKVTESKVIEAVRAQAVAPKVKREPGEGESGIVGLRR